MRNYNLGFISDQNIYNHVRETVEKYRFTINLNEFMRNLPDPIKLTFDAGVYQKDIESIIEHEAFRQIDKSNNNYIGYFHQNIFRYLGQGWEIPETGYDLINNHLMYFVEIKNKHNTMNSSSAQKTYMRMQDTVLHNPHATCMLVEVIAKKSQNLPWQISLDGQCVSHEKIRRVSMDKFYGLVTGDQFAFKKLCKQLPIIIQDVVEDNQFKIESNSVVSELKKIDEKLLQRLYLLSFATYEGFSQGFE